MQTFLPYPDMVRSAAVLDFRRLGKQRLEAKQILHSLLRKEEVLLKQFGISAAGNGWANHPATKMWAGHEKCLARYGLIMCMEFRDRGYRDNMRNDFILMFRELPKETAGYPSWFGNDAFHASHRSNLLRKDPIHYGQFGWSEPTDLPYVWPTS